MTSDSQIHPDGFPTKLLAIISSLCSLQHFSGQALHSSHWKVWFSKHTENQETKVRRRPAVFMCSMIYLQCVSPEIRGGACCKSPELKCCLLPRIQGRKFPQPPVIHFPVPCGYRAFHPCWGFLLAGLRQGSESTGSCCHTGYVPPPCLLPRILLEEAGVCSKLEEVL